jgi:hypothetical protein
MDNEKLALNITKALAYTENGGKPDIHKEQQGKSGEMKSIFQFLPATWKEDSKQVTGKENVPLTPETEAYVVNAKVSNWLKQGYNPSQIFSMWNSGSPNSEGKVGTNKEGVKYDTPKYVATAQSYLDKFMGAPQEMPDSNTQNPEVQQPSIKSPIDPSLASQNIPGGAVPTLPQLAQQQKTPQQGILPQLAKQNAIAKLS